MPSTQPTFEAPPDPGLVLQWARVADEAGISALTVHDRPNHWTWEPLAALAAVAPVTRHARLMTSALLLPPRPEGLVAKQAAVVDQLSGGRLDQGLTPGSAPDRLRRPRRPVRAAGRPVRPSARPARRAVGGRAAGG